MAPQTVEPVFFAHFFLRLALKIKVLFPADPSDNLDVKMREMGLSGCPPDGPSYSTVGGSEQNLDLYHENEFFKIPNFLRKIRIFLTRSTVHI
jgi:hypothetical protein